MSQLDNFLDPDFVSLDARAQVNREDIAIIIDQSGQDAFAPIPGVTPENQANKNQVNGYAGLDGSAKVPIALINLPTSSNVLGSDVPMTLANTFYDGTSVSLSAGKWLVTVQITFGRTVAAACAFTGRIANGGTFYASGEISAPATTFYATITLIAIITLGSTATIKAQGACTSTDGSLIATAPDNSSGATANQINAVRIA